MQPVHFDAGLRQQNGMEKSASVDSQRSPGALTGMSVCTVSAKVVANLHGIRYKPSIRFSQGIHFMLKALYSSANAPSNKVARQGIVTVRHVVLTRMGVEVMRASNEQC